MLLVLQWFCIGFVYFPRCKKVQKEVLEFNLVFNLVLGYLNTL